MKLMDSELTFNSDFAFVAWLKKIGWKGECKQIQPNVLEYRDTKGNPIARATYKDSKYTYKVLTK